MNARRRKLGELILANNAQQIALTEELRVYHRFHPGNDVQQNKVAAAVKWWDGWRERLAVLDTLEQEYAALSREDEELMLKQYQHDPHIETAPFVPASSGEKEEAAPQVLNYELPF